MSEPSDGEVVSTLDVERAPSAIESNHGAVEGAAENFLEELRGETFQGGHFCFFTFLLLSPFSPFSSLH